MELIREALNKAKAADGSRRNLTPAALRHPDAPVAPWSLPRVVLDANHLESQRIVSYTMSDPSHVAFNVLRTKVFKTMKDNKWTTLAVLSPTAGCGKTTVSINLALSLARAGCRTVLVDLDLKKAAMAKALGIKLKASIGQFLEGEAELQQCFVQIGDNLVIGLNTKPVKLSSEVLQDQRVNDLVEGVRNAINPDLIMFDLPPLLVSDDALAFLPRVDCSMLVVAAGMTTAMQIDECERQASAASNFIGVVLNKCESNAQEHYKYGGY